MRLLAMAQEEEEEEERRRREEKREKKEMKEKKEKKKEKRGVWGRGDDDWSPKLRGGPKKNRPRAH